MISGDSLGDRTTSPPSNQENGLSSEANIAFLRAARAGILEKVLDSLKHGVDINYQNSNGLNALHLASKEGHLLVVEELLARGADVDVATKKGNTALHISALAGKTAVVRTLVEHGAKVNIQSQAGFTALYMAAQENHDDVVRYLLEKGADPSLTTEEGYTPLAVALQQGSEKAVGVLLEYGQGSKVKLPALHIAAKKDDVGAAALLLKSDSVNRENAGDLVNETTKSGFTPLHIAAHYGRVNVAKLLIDKGADVNYKAKNAIAPLHVAAKWGQTGMVAVLLERNANINIQNKDGLTPLHCAARSGYPRVLDYMLEKGADHSAKTKNGLTPLHMATQGDHVDCARLLLHYQASIDDVTVDYLTALHVAAHYGHIKTAKLLLDRNCEPNARALNGFTPLHIACKKNRIKIVELLLKYGASIEATTESGLTPLHVAAFMGNMNIVLSLLQNGAAVDQQTLRGETPLHLAARANQTDVMRILLRNKANVNAKAREQQTPLHISARMGNVDSVLLLLQHGAAPEALTKDGYTPLHIAAKEGHEEVAAVLIDQGAAPDSATKKGMTPVHIAAKYGQKSVARLLLQRGAAPDAAGKNGLTPLHVAAHYSRADIGVLLLESRASPHCIAKNGYTPLHIAAKKNQMDMATSLLEYGARPDTESKTGFAPLHLAAQEGHTDMTSLLLEHKANANCRAANGLTPMHLCAQEDRVSVAEILYKYGSEIDPRTKAGYTPLHTACHFGQLNMVRFLLQHQADVNATTRLGYAPLHQAAQQGHAHVVSLLLKHGASPDARTNTGLTPLHIARRLGYVSVEELLKGITTDAAAPPPNAHVFSTEKYKMEVPEKMEEITYSDSEEEGDDDTIFPDHYSYLRSDNFVGLGDGNATPQESFSEMQSPIGSPGSVVIRRGKRRKVQDMSASELRQAPALADDESLSLTSATPLLGKVFVLDAAAAASAAVPEAVAELQSPAAELDDSSSQLLPYSEDFREQKPVKPVRGVTSITPYSVDRRESEPFGGEEGTALAASLSADDSELVEAAVEQPPLLPTAAPDRGGAESDFPGLTADEIRERRTLALKGGARVDLLENYVEGRDGRYYPPGGDVASATQLDDSAAAESAAPGYMECDNAEPVATVDSAAASQAAPTDGAGEPVMDTVATSVPLQAAANASALDAMEASALSGSMSEDFVSDTLQRYWVGSRDNGGEVSPHWSRAPVDDSAPPGEEAQQQKGVGLFIPPKGQDVTMYDLYKDQQVTASAVQPLAAPSVAAPSVAAAAEVESGLSPDVQPALAIAYSLTPEGLVRGPDGQPVLGRDGQPVVLSQEPDAYGGYTLAPDGTVLTPNQRPVIGVDGHPVRVTPSGHKIILEPSGRLLAVAEELPSSSSGGGSGSSGARKLLVVPPGSTLLAPGKDGRVKVPASTTAATSASGEKLLLDKDGKPVTVKGGTALVVAAPDGRAVCASDGKPVTAEPGSVLITPGLTCYVVSLPDGRPVLNKDGCPVCAPAGSRLCYAGADGQLKGADGESILVSDPHTWGVVLDGSGQLAALLPVLGEPAGSGDAASKPAIRVPMSCELCHIRADGFVQRLDRKVAGANGKPVRLPAGTESALVVVDTDNNVVVGQDGRPLLVASGSRIVAPRPDGTVPTESGPLLNKAGEAVRLNPEGSCFVVTPDNTLATTKDGKFVRVAPGSLVLVPAKDGKLKGADGKKLVGPNGKSLKVDMPPSVAASSVLGRDIAAVVVEPGNKLVKDKDGKPVRVPPNSRILAPGEDGRMVDKNGKPVQNQSGTAMQVLPERSLVIVDSTQRPVLDKSGSIITVPAGSQLALPGHTEYVLGPDGRPVLNADGQPLALDPGCQLVLTLADGTAHLADGSKVTGSDGKAIKSSAGTMIIVGPDNVAVADASRRQQSVTVPPGSVVVLPRQHVVMRLDGRPLLDPSTHRALGVAPDGDTLLVPADDGGLVRLTAEGAPVHDSSGRTVLVAPRWLLLVDAASGQPVLDARGQAIAAPPGSCLAAPGQLLYLVNPVDKRVVEDPADGQPVWVATGTRLYSADEDGYVTLPAHHGGSKLLGTDEFPLHVPAGQLAVVGPDGRFVAFADGSPVFVPAGCIMLAPGYDFVRSLSGQALEDALGRPIVVEPGTTVVEANTSGEVLLTDGRHASKRAPGQPDEPALVTPCSLVLVSPDGHLVCTQAGAPQTVPRGSRITTVQQDLVVQPDGQFVLDPDSAPSRPLEVAPGTKIVSASADGHVHLPDGSKVKGLDGCPVVLEPGKQVLVLPDGKAVTDKQGQPLEVPAGSKVVPRPVGTGTLRKSKALSPAATSATASTPAGLPSPAPVGADAEALVVVQVAPSLSSASPHTTLSSPDAADKSQPAAVSGAFSPTSPPPLPTTLPPGSLPWSLFSQVNSSVPREKTIEASYSGPSFGADLNPDNVAVDRSPVFTGFLVSFMVDARGGAMRGCRHAGMRLVIPPRCATCPTRITCRMVRRERLSGGGSKVSLPPIGDGEALAARVIQLSPVGTRFLRPVILEIPHFASLRGREREIVIMRSDDGHTWKEHTLKATDELVSDTVAGSFDDIEPTDELERKRITRILTPDFPQYFALITRPRLEATLMGPAGGILNSTIVSQAQAVFPDGALKKQIRVGIQALPVPADVVARLLGNRVAVSAVVTVEPRRRRFHKPITLTIPVPKAAQRGMVNHYEGEARNTLRLLYSISEDANPAQWEDITGSTPLTFVSDCVSFTTTLSARFWLVDCQNTSEVVKMATTLYKDIVSVPFMCKFVVFAKRHESREARLRVFCMTDDKIDKTLETQEHFHEIARSRDIEVLEGKPLYVEMAGSLLPVTRSSDEQLHVCFCAFKENRLPFIVRLRGDSGDFDSDASRPSATGRIAFMRHPKAGKADVPQVPLCNLNLRLPDYVPASGSADEDIDSTVDSHSGREPSRKAFDHDLPTIARTGLLGEPQAWKEEQPTAHVAADSQLSSTSSSSGAAVQSPDASAVQPDIANDGDREQERDSRAAAEPQEGLPAEEADDIVHEEAVVPQMAAPPSLLLNLKLPSSPPLDASTRHDVPEEEGVSTPPSSPAEPSAGLQFDAGLSSDAITEMAACEGDDTFDVESSHDTASEAIEPLQQLGPAHGCSGTSDSASLGQGQESAADAEVSHNHLTSDTGFGDAEPLPSQEPELLDASSTGSGTVVVSHDIEGSGLPRITGSVDDQQSPEEDEEVCSSSGRHHDGSGGDGTGTPASGLAEDGPAVAAIASMTLSAASECGSASSSLSSSYERPGHDDALGVAMSSSLAGCSASDSLAEQLTSSVYSDVSALSASSASYGSAAAAIATAGTGSGGGSWPEQDEHGGVEKHECEERMELEQDAYAEHFVEDVVHAEEGDGDAASARAACDDDDDDITVASSLAAQEKCVSELKESEKHVRFPADGCLTDIVHSNEIYSESDSSLSAVHRSSDTLSPDEEPRGFETVHAVDELALFPCKERHGGEEKEMDSTIVDGAQPFVEPDSPPRFGGSSDPIRDLDNEGTELSPWAPPSLSGACTVEPPFVADSPAVSEREKEQAGGRDGELVGSARQPLRFTLSSEAQMSSPPCLAALQSFDSSSAVSSPQSIEDAVGVGSSRVPTEEGATASERTDVTAALAAAPLADGSLLTEISEPGAAAHADVAGAADGVFVSDVYSSGADDVGSTSMVSRPLHTIEEMPTVFSYPTSKSSAASIAFGSAYITVDRGLNEMAADDRAAGASDAGSPTSPPALSYERSQSMSEASCSPYDEGALATGFCDVPTSTSAVRRSPRRHHSLPDCAGSSSDAPHQEFVQQLVSLPEGDVSSDAHDGDPGEFSSAATPFALNCGERQQPQQQHADCEPDTADRSAASAAAGQLLPAIESPVAAVHCDQVEGACFGKPRRDLGDRGSPTYVSYDDLSRPSSIVLMPSDAAAASQPSLGVRTGKLHRDSDDDWSKIGVFGSLDGIDLQQQHADLGGMSGGDSGLGGTDGSPSLCLHNLMTDSYATNATDDGTHSSSAGGGSGLEFRDAAEAAAAAAAAGDALDAGDSTSGSASLRRLHWESRLVEEMERCLAASDLIDVRESGGAETGDGQLPAAGGVDADAGDACNDAHEGDEDAFECDEDSHERSPDALEEDDDDDVGSFEQGEDAHEQEDACQSDQEGLEREEGVHVHSECSPTLRRSPAPADGELLRLAVVPDAPPAEDNEMIVGLTDGRHYGWPADASAPDDQSPCELSANSALPSADCIVDAAAAAEAGLPDAAAEREDYGQEQPHGSHAVTILVMDADSSEHSFARDFGRTVEYDDTDVELEDATGPRAASADDDWQLVSGADCRVDSPPGHECLPSEPASHLPDNPSSSPQRPSNDSALSAATDASFTAATYLVQTGEVVEFAGGAPVVFPSAAVSAVGTEVSSASADACGTMSSSMSDDVFYEDWKLRSRSALDGESPGLHGAGATVRHVPVRSCADSAGGSYASVSVLRHVSAPGSATTAEWSDEGSSQPQEQQPSDAGFPPAAKAAYPTAAVTVSSVTAASAALAVAPYLTELFDSTEYGGVHTPESFGLSITPEDYPSSDVSPSRDACFVGAVSLECRRRRSGQLDDQETFVHRDMNEDSEKDVSGCSDDEQDDGPELAPDGGSAVVVGGDENGLPAGAPGILGHDEHVKPWLADRQSDRDAAAGQACEEAPLSVLQDTCDQAEAGKAAQQPDGCHPALCGDEQDQSSGCDRSDAADSNCLPAVTTAEEHVDVDGIGTAGVSRSPALTPDEKSGAGSEDEKSGAGSEDEKSGAGSEDEKSGACSKDEKSGAGSEDEKSGAGSEDEKSGAGSDEGLTICPSPDAEQVFYPQDRSDMSSAQTPEGCSMLRNDDGNVAMTTAHSIPTAAERSDSMAGRDQPGDEAMDFRTKIEEAMADSSPPPSPSNDSEYKASAGYDDELRPPTPTSADHAAAAASGAGSSPATAEDIDEQPDKWWLQSGSAGEAEQSTVSLYDELSAAFTLDNAATGSAPEDDTTPADCDGGLGLPQRHEDQDQRDDVSGSDDSVVVADYPPGGSDEIEAACTINDTEDDSGWTKVGSSDALVAADDEASKCTDAADEAGLLLSPSIPSSPQHEPLSVASASESIITLSDSIVRSPRCHTEADSEPECGEQQYRWDQPPDGESDDNDGMIIYDRLDDDDDDQEEAAILDMVSAYGIYHERQLSAVEEVSESDCSSDRPEEDEPAAAISEQAPACTEIQASTATCRDHVASHAHYVDMVLQELMEPASGDTAASAPERAAASSSTRDERSEPSGGIADSSRLSGAEADADSQSVDDELEISSVDSYATVVMPSADTAQDESEAARDDDDDRLADFSSSMTSSVHSSFMGDDATRASVADVEVPAAAALPSVRSLPQLEPGSGQLDSASTPTSDVAMSVCDTVGSGVLAAKAKDADAISMSSLCEFETLEHEVECRQLSATSSPSTPRRHLSPLSEQSPLAQQNPPLLLAGAAAATAPAPPFSPPRCRRVVARRSCNSTSDEANKRSSLCSLEEFEIVEKDITTCDEVEREALKVVASLESGELLLEADDDGAMLSPPVPLRLPAAATSRPADGMAFEIRSGRLVLFSMSSAAPLAAATSTEAEMAERPVDTDGVPQTGETGDVQHAPDAILSAAATTASQLQGADDIEAIILEASHNVEAFMPELSAAESGTRTEVAGSGTDLMQWSTDSVETQTQHAHPDLQPPSSAEPGAQEPAAPSDLACSIDSLDGGSAAVEMATARSPSCPAGAPALGAARHGALIVQPAQDVDIASIIGEQIYAEDILTAPYSTATVSDHIEGGWQREGSDSPPAFLHLTTTEPAAAEPPGAAVDHWHMGGSGSTAEPSGVSCDVMALARHEFARRSDGAACEWSSTSAAQLRHELSSVSSEQQHSECSASSSAGELRQTEYSCTVREVRTSYETFTTSSEAFEECVMADEFSAASSFSQMSASFHQAYPQSLNPFSDAFCPAPSEEEEEEPCAGGEAEGANVTRKAAAPAALLATRVVTAAYASDYRYEAKQKVFTMAELEAERTNRRLAATLNSSGSGRSQLQQPSTDHSSTTTPPADKPVMERSEDETEEDNKNAPNDLL